MTDTHLPISFDDAAARLEELVMAARDGAVFHLVGPNDEACVLIGAKAFDTLIASEKPSEG